MSPRGLDKKWPVDLSNQNLCFGTMCPELPANPNPSIIWAPSFGAQINTFLLYSHPQVNCKLVSEKEKNQFGTPVRGPKSTQLCACLFSGPQLP